MDTNPMAPVSPQMPETSSPARKLNTKLIATIVAVLVLGGAVYGAYWWWGNRQAEVADPIKTPDKTANWQTYRNDKFGYEFKYLPGAVLTASDDGIGRDVPITNNAFEVRVRPGIEKDIIFIVSNSQLTQFLTSDFVSSQFADPAKIRPVAVTMFGLAGFKVASDGYVASDHYYLQKSNGYFVHIIVNGELANQILSTFRFTETISPAPVSQFCGGIAGIPCPSGYTCKLDGSYPDAGGTCVKDDKVCAQVITPARNKTTGEIREFPTPCDVPGGWEILLSR